MTSTRMPSHLPSTISERRIGFEASVCMTPEAISPGQRVDRQQHRGHHREEVDGVEPGEQ